MADGMRIRTGIALHAASGRWIVVQNRGDQIYRSEQTYATEAEAEAVARSVVRKLHDVLDERGIRWADRARPGRPRR